MLRQELEELHGKYSEMLVMRLDHDAGTEDALRARQRMASLATRFPGALREIDDLELHEIRRRMAALDAVIHRNAEAEPWMGAVASFHSLARGALCAKRWLAGRKHVDGVVAKAYAAAVPVLPFPKDADRWIQDLGAVAKPPRGRLLDLVFARLAAQLQTTERDARHLVFGTPRPKRRPKPPPQAPPDTFR